MTAATIVSGMNSAEIPDSGTEDAGHAYIRSNPVGIITKSRIAGKNPSKQFVFRRLLCNGDTVVGVF